MNPVLPGPVMCIVGARPNFMKMAPILRALAAHAPPLPAFLVHTGQHYDQDMSDKLFEDLRLPRPDLNLEVGSGTHAVQTAEVMRRRSMSTSRAAWSWSATSIRRWPAAWSR